MSVIMVIGTIFIVLASIVVGVALVLIVLGYLEELDVVGRLIDYGAWKAKQHRWKSEDKKNDYRNSKTR